MDRLGRRAEAFDGFVLAKRSSEMKSALEDYWKGTSGLAPFFLWDRQESSFADHVEGLVGRLDRLPDRGYLGNMLIVLCLSTVASWRLDAGASRLDEILDIMRLTGKRGLGIKNVPLDRGRVITAPPLSILHDQLCTQATLIEPDLHDPQTAANYANACMSLFHCPAEWWEDSPADGRLRLAEHAFGLLQCDWDMPSIDESCRAAIHLWAAWYINDRDGYLSVDAYRSEIWSRIAGKAPLPRQRPTDEYLRYSLASAYSDVFERFGSGHTDSPAAVAREEAALIPARTIDHGAVEAALAAAELSGET